MIPRISWEQAAAAGMTVTEAATARRKVPSAGTAYAKRHGLKFAPDPKAKRKPKAEPK